MKYPLSPLTPFPPAFAQHSPPTALLTVISGDATPPFPSPRRFNDLRTLLRDGVTLSSLFSIGCALFACRWGWYPPTIRIPPERCVRRFEASSASTRRTRRLRVIRSPQRYLGGQEWRLGYNRGRSLTA